MNNLFCQDHQVDRLILESGFGNVLENDGFHDPADSQGRQSDEPQ